MTTETIETNGIAPEKLEVKIETTDEVLGDGGKKALVEERSQRRTVEKQLKELQQKLEGVDPEKYQSLLKLEQDQSKAIQERQQKELEAQKKYDEAIAHRDQTYAADKAALQKQLDELQQRLEIKDKAIAQKEIQRSFTVAFDQAGGYAEDAITLLASPDIGAWLKYDNDEAEVIVANPKTGDRPTDDKGNYLSVKSWIETWKPTKLRFFKPQNTNSGGGTPPTKPGQVNTGQAIALGTPKDFDFSSLMDAGRRKKS